MVMVKIKGKNWRHILYEFYMNGFLLNNLQMVKKAVRRDYDAFIVVTGREGFGKTTLAFQCAVWLDKTFNLDRVCFTAEQFMKAVDVAEKYQVVVFDEAMGYLASRGAMSKFNRALIKVMAEMRSKNLIIFICIPNFFELERYVAIHRSTGLLHVKHRGAFGSYDYSKKKALYLKGRKEYSYSIPPTFIGDFKDYFPLDKEKYEEKKQKAIKQWIKDPKRLKSLEFEGFKA